MGSVDPGSEGDRSPVVSVTDPPGSYIERTFEKMQTDLWTYWTQRVRPERVGTSPLPPLSRRRTDPDEVRTEVREQ